MTSQRKDGKKPGRQASVEDVVKRTMDVLKGMPSVPVYLLIVLDLLKNSLANLQHYIDTDQEDISWSNPFTELQYAVDLVEVEELPDVVADEAEIQEAVLERLPQGLEAAALMVLTRGVRVRLVEPYTDESGRACDCRISLPPEVDAEVKALPEAEREAKLTELVQGIGIPGLGPVTITIEVEEDRCDPPFPGLYSADLIFQVRPLTIDTIHGRAYFPIMVGLAFHEPTHNTAFDPSNFPDEVKADIWRSLFQEIKDLEDPLLKQLEAEGLPPPKPVKKDRIGPPERFAVAGSYTYPIYELSKYKSKLPLLRDFYAPQTPLNWAVGLALFSLTDADRVRSGDFQEAKIGNLVDRVFCLTERDAPRRGDYRSDILAEVVKLTWPNYYYDFETIKVGRVYKKRPILGSITAIPEMQLVFIDRKTGKRTLPTDAAVRGQKIPLEVQGRRVTKPDGKHILALPMDRWKLDAIRWRWVQSFNDDLLMKPAMIEGGRLVGLPKKTTTGKVVRNWMIQVALNIFSAMQILRAEGPRSVYAHRLLFMLVHNLHKTEDGIAADRVFRMLCIGDDFTRKTHRKPEDIVADAVYRLKQRDIGALQPGSDEYPRPPSEAERKSGRRKSDYYRLVRSPEFMPPTGIVSKEEAEAIEAEYSPAGTKPAAPPIQKAKQKTLPGLDLPPAPPVPSGSDIRAAREAAGTNLRDFARKMGGPSFKTWSLIETGQRSPRSGRIPEDVWQRVRDFVAQHKPKDDPDGGKAGS